MRASSIGLLSAFGHDPRIAIREFHGDVEFNNAATTLDEARLQMRIQADSLEVVDDISEKDREEIERRTSVEVLQSVSPISLTSACTLREAAMASVIG